MASHNDLGQWGEQVAADYLQQRGWYVRHRDWRSGHRDIDIAAIDGDMSILLIVEVKTRATAVHGAPDMAIDDAKRTNIMLATEAYVRQYHFEYLDVRYDTISVIGTPDSGYTIEHKENAFDITSRYDFYDARRKAAPYAKRPGCW